MLKSLERFGPTPIVSGFHRALSDSSIELRTGISSVSTWWLPYHR